MEQLRLDKKELEIKIKELLDDFCEKHGDCGFDIQMTINYHEFANHDKTFIGSTVNVNVII